MNRLIFLFLSLITIFGISCQNNKIPGLVASYSFSGNTFDESGNKNHAVVHGALQTSDRFGKENSAYHFDGTSAYLQVMISGMPAVENPQTISFWFMVDQEPEFLDSLGADNSISLVDSVSGVGLQFGYRASGYNTLGFDTWYWGGQTVLEAAHPTINEWHHVAYTYNGESHLFYLDGQQTAQSNVKPQQGTPKMLMFGNYPGGDQFFMGSLGDVLIYNRALTHSEIELLYSKKE